MKRWICVVLAVLVLLPVFSTTAFAAGHGHEHGGHSGAVKHRGVTEQVCNDNTDCGKNGICVNNCRYVDENGDKVCDNCENQCANCGATKDDNADGICDKCGKCSHYADENTDGVCDHQANCKNSKQTASKPAQRKCGNYGGRHGHHH